MLSKAFSEIGLESRNQVLKEKVQKEVKRLGNKPYKNIRKAKGASM